MSPDLKRRIQDVAVGAVVGALAVGIPAWRDLGMLQTDMAAVKRDTARIETQMGEYVRRDLTVPGWKNDLSTPKQELKR